MVIDYLAQADRTDKAKKLRHRWLLLASQEGRS